MGLDMYLTGRKYLFTDWQKPENNPTEDSFRVKERVLELGYWRKHPDLHGYIVQTFADGVDECQDIPLSVEQLEQTLGASELGHLPKTTGFFFGESQAEDREATKEILLAAIRWLRGATDRERRSVVYRASW